MKLGNWGAADEVALSAHLPTNELVRFRTKLCGRKALYGECGLEDSCPFSHCLSWSRRNPLKHAYRPQLCPNVKFEQIDGKMKVTSNCLRGRMCMYAHTKEEQMYHPLVYKTQLCNFFHQQKGCDKHFCPFAHGINELANPEDVDFNPLQGPELLLDSFTYSSSKICKKANNKGNFVSIKLGKVPSCGKSKCNQLQGRKMMLPPLGAQSEKMKFELLTCSNTSESQTIFTEYIQQHEVTSVSPVSSLPYIAFSTTPSFVSSFSTVSDDSFEQFNHNKSCSSNANDSFLDKQVEAKQQQYIIDASKSILVRTPRIERLCNNKISEPPPGFEKKTVTGRSMNFNKDRFQFSQDGRFNFSGDGEKAEVIDTLNSSLSSDSVIEGFVEYPCGNEKYTDCLNKDSTSKAMPVSPSGSRHSQQAIPKVRNKSNGPNSSKCSTRASRSGSTASLTSVDTNCVSPMEQSPSSVSQTEAPVQLHTFSHLPSLPVAAGDADGGGGYLLKLKQLKSLLSCCLLSEAECILDGNVESISKVGLPDIQRRILSNNLENISMTNLSYSSFVNLDLLSCSNFIDSDSELNADNLAFKQSEDLHRDTHDNYLSCIESLKHFSNDRSDVKMKYATNEAATASSSYTDQLLRVLENLLRSVSLLDVDKEINPESTATYTTKNAVQTQNLGFSCTNSVSGELRNLKEFVPNISEPILPIIASSPTRVPHVSFPSMHSSATQEAKTKSSDASFFF